MLAATRRLQNTRNRLHLNTSALAPLPYGIVMMRSCRHTHTHTSIETSTQAASRQGAFQCAQCCGCAARFGSTERTTRTPCPLPPRASPARPCAAPPLTQQAHTCKTPYSSRLPTTPTTQKARCSASLPNNGGGCGPLLLLLLLFCCCGAPGAPSAAAAGFDMVMTAGLSCELWQGLSM